ncbi:MAG: acetyl-CoA carboxylase biotin carboxyl carrier protein [Alphaproteobacteria bacterium]|nr:acetyl-CoA carboxylase biotin carboxyl carrier protein [Alphaproteobacteria bacterium]
MSNPIDTKVISKLAEILDKTNLTELEYEDESCRISLSRNCGASVVPSFVQASAPVVQPAVVETKEEQDKDDNQMQNYENDPNAVKSPMVGVVYLSSDPTADTYVHVGDMVEAGTTVCLIEAMKTFNPVKAHKGGRVTKVLVEAGDPVEYGAPLIVIE